jgi:holo-[acyl-carrier protein] synthase
LGGALVGIGIDSVDIERFGGVLARRSSLAGRLFTTAERDLAGRLVDPIPTLAGRFAAKEAAMKALGVGLGSIDWSDVEVVRAQGGQPVLAVTGRAAALAGRIGARSWFVSITHTDTIASAVVAAVT